MPGLHKRSLMIAGHRTSVALEPEFWAALEDAAREERVALAMLISGIDQDRATGAPDRLLASACRVYALNRARRR